MSGQTDVRTFLVDDEPAVTRGLKFLLSSIGIECEICGDGPAFLAGLAACPGPACAVLDLRMPGMTGLEVLEALAAQRDDVPVIVLTAHGDIDSAVRAMKLGALDFLQKPFEPASFVALLHDAIGQARTRHAAALAARRRDALLEPLSARERELLPLLLDGASSKEVARRLGLSPRTVDVHRASILHKTGAPTMRELAACLRDAAGGEPAPR